MGKTPAITRFIDDEEQALVDAIERDDYEVGDNALTIERFKELQAAARATMDEARTKISLRVPKSDLARLKARALQEGVPYQSIINSLIHKYVS